MARNTNVLGIILAGGAGTRLQPLTLDRAKPAVPFGGNYRLIDFVLSNMVNGGIYRIAVLTQYKSHSLDRHIAKTWQMSSLMGNYVSSVPAQQRTGPRWYQGSADAIYQSLNTIDEEDPGYVVVFGADNVYRMDPAQMLEAHIATGAGLTVAGIRVSKEEATEFGVIQTADGKKIDAFVEKPADPPTVPDDPNVCYASMGNYIFSTDVLREILLEDAADESSKHDMGGNIVPALVARGQAYVYDFTQNDIPGSTPRDRAYWRDVGSLAAYHEAHMDLVSVDPLFNLYNTQWPIMTGHPHLPGAKFVEGGAARESIVSQGCIIAGSFVDQSVLSPGVRVLKGAAVSSSVVMHGAVIGERAVVRNAILDKGVVVPEGATIGVDLDADRHRGYTVTEEGIVVLGKGQKVIR